jgi:Histidine kinase
MRPGAAFIAFYVLMTQRNNYFGAPQIYYCAAQEVLLYCMLRQAVKIFLHLLFWLAVYLLPFLVAYGNVRMATVFGEPGGIIHAASTALLIGYAYFNHYVLVPILYLHRKYFVYAGLVAACALLVIWFPNILRVFEHHEHFAHPGPGPHQRGGPRGGGFKLDYNIILFLLCTFASISIRQQRQLLEVQKEKLDAELSFLKAQINPHFLFNTLNSIYALSIRKSDDTPQAIIQLSELMRYILKDANAVSVPLEKELSYMSNYVALQKRRLGDTVQITYSVPPNVANQHIAPLILMSFVENAFKHGVNPDQDSSISISISIKDKQLHLLVINNKVTSVNSEETMGIGLKNATSRLEHLYPGKHKLSIDDGEKTFAINLILDLND